MACASAFACSGEDATVSQACNALVTATNTYYTLSMPAEHKTAKVYVVLNARTDGFSDFTVHGEYRAADLVRNFSLPRVLRDCLAPNTNGEVKLELQTVDKHRTNVWKFSSTGTAESLYALRLLSPEPKWPVEMAQRIPASGIVEEMPDKTLEELLKNGSSIIGTSATGLELAGVAKPFFNEHRAEILSKSGRGLLFYPRAEHLDWSLRQSGDVAYAIS